MPERRLRFLIPLPVLNSSVPMTAPLEVWCADERTPVPRGYAVVDVVPRPDGSLGLGLVDALVPTDEKTA